jgi:hypothetical protein
LIDSARRVIALVRADFCIRMRRPSTVVVFLLLGFSAYLWVPDPGSGRALLVIDGHRALLNSAAVGMATASLGSIFIGLIGFYVVSNALRRDVESRCGTVIAGTEVGSGEYLVGKTLGNIAFLATFMSGFMLISMAMVLVRGEAPLEPLVFMRQYVLLVPGAIVMAAVVAIVFESIPGLSGRFGDVAYFFLWLGLLLPGAILAQGGAGASPTMAAYLDPSAFGFMIARLTSILGTNQVSIGATGFDTGASTIVFSGLSLPRGWILPRLSSILSPFLLLLPAVAFFHRFDPARTGRITSRAHWSLFSRVQKVLKPVTSRLVRMLRGRPGKNGATLLSTARRDAALTLELFPAAVLALSVLWIVALVQSTATMMRGLMPVLFVVLTVVVADVPCRERRSGTLNLIASCPGLDRAFVRWKMLSTLLVAGIFAAVGILKAAWTAPGSLAALLVGLALVSAASTFLGVMSSNPKTFIVVFLSFWYVVVNDAGRTSGLDFAGFYSAATPSVVIGYALLAVVFYLAAEIVYGRRRRLTW